MTRPQIPLSIEYILMGLLAQRPMHGYDLYKEISSLPAIAMIWGIKQSQLYALLDRLEKEGLLASTLLPGETRPARRQYHLTGQGYEVLAQWVSTPVEHNRDMRQEFLARLYFASRAGTSSAVDLICRQRIACQDWLQGLEKDRRALSPGQDFEKMVIGFRLSQVRAMLGWLDECERDLSL